MSRFAIFSFLALFCIGFAPARAVLLSLHQLKKAKIQLFGPRASVREFSGEDLHLYKKSESSSSVLKSFAVGNESNSEGRTEFAVSLAATIVTKQNIIISFPAREVTLTLPDNEDTFALYQDMLYRLGNYFCNFRVTKVSQNGVELAGVTVIESRPYAPNEWLFAALDANGVPHLVFTNKRIDSWLTSDDINLEASFKLETHPAIKVDIRFLNAQETQKFYSVVV